MMSDAARRAEQIERTEELLRKAWELRDQFMADPHRPTYHFMAPSAWMNDINGAVYWKGRYHLFYQHTPDQAHWDSIRWGHASSVDLIHWVHHPIAFSPDPEGPDREGCFSGVMVDNEGVATAVYHGAPDGTCLATSDDDDLITWRKHPSNPVIPVPQPGQPDFGRYKVFDPCAWREGNTWYALCGNVNPQGRDTAYLFQSQDMVHWEYLHQFYKPRPEWTQRGEDCAVPTFFPLDGRHVLLFVSHKYGCQYYIGDYRDHRFFPRKHGRMNWAGGQLIAPMNMLDDKGRRLFFGWVCEARHDKVARAAGWAGVMTVPRLLTIREDGGLGIEPIPELEALRRDHHRLTDVRLAAGCELPLEQIRGDCLEFCVELSPGRAEEVGVLVRCSPDGAERTMIAYNPSQGTLRIDTSASSLSGDVVRPWPCPWGVMYDDPLETRVLPHHDSPVPIADVAVQVAPLILSQDEMLRLRVFLDRSILEVFANGRQCLTQRIYPSRGDSLGAGVFARGEDAHLVRLDAWRMGPAVS